MRGFFFFLNENLKGRRCFSFNTHRHLTSLLLIWRNHKTDTYEVKRSPVFFLPSLCYDVTSRHDDRLAAIMVNRHLTEVSAADWNRVTSLSSPWALFALDSFVHTATVWPFLQEYLRTSKSTMSGYIFLLFSIFFYKCIIYAQPLVLSFCIVFLFLYSSVFYCWCTTLGLSDYVLYTVYTVMLTITLSWITWILNGL